MQKMYEDYSDVAEFVLVYIREAHASDSDWPVAYAKELGIKEHKDYGERCSIAGRLLVDKKLNIPTVVDSMDDGVNRAYKAWPDRVIVVRKDGRLAVAAARGPWGFVPAIEKAKQWLSEYKKTGKEPALPEKSKESGKQTPPKDE